MQLLDKGGDQINDAEAVEVNGEANPGIRRLFNTIFMIYYVVLAFMGMSQYWSYDMPGCSGLGIFHRFLGMWLYKPFFVPFGIVQILVSADLMFTMSKMPEKLSQVPDVVTFIVYWFFIVPYVSVMFAMMFP
jgi:hypothetical protein